MAVTSVTHQPPKGFEFVGAEYSNLKVAPLSWTVTSDPATGAVTLTAPPGGWAMDQYINFRFKYKAGDALRGADGDHGATFTGTGVSPTGDWLVTGNTRVQPDS
ncbi:hypothetical protein [Rhodococcus tukisamuensis]|uniref:hypothetical protein n=1 Tax=Rhodococcus tukisamuensis TaxID=168276 RepID=UPI001113D9BE|nr:hypothetical protein [Rhodococcus tukisamuensis]